MDRVGTLKQILEQNPKDAFARYGLALEYSQQNQIDAALAEFKALLTDHPEYVPGYQMAGQMLAGAERTQEALQYLQQGMAVAERVGNAHARSEMETLLEELSRD